MTNRQSSPPGTPRRHGGSFLLPLLILALAWARPCRACDLCAIYTATEMTEGKTGVRIGVAEQFTRFATLQRGGERVANPFDERLDSSITQLLLGYNFTPRIGMQVNLPIISRTFRRATADGVERGDETGVGDLSLIGSFNAYSTYTENSLLRVTLFGGLKLPSGDSDRLREELAEDHDGEDDHDPGPVDPRDLFPRPGTSAAARLRANHETGGSQVESGIHGHDLALGSGSVDGLVGAHLFASWRRLFFTGNVQYLIRTEGDFDYEYANDLLWSTGFGIFLLTGHDLARRDYTLGTRASLSGESKGMDTLNGVDANDTALTSMYIGPGLTFTWGTSLSADVAGEMPVLLNNSSLQIVPDYRIRGGVTWRF